MPEKAVIQEIFRCLEKGGVLFHLFCLSGRKTEELCEGFDAEYDHR